MRISTRENKSWSRLGMRVVEKFAGSGSPKPVADSAGEDGVQPLVALGCCNLAKTSDATCLDRCGGSYHWKSWGCCQSGEFYSCGECTTGSNCSSGSFLCSYGTHVPGGCA